MLQQTALSVSLGAVAVQTETRRDLRITNTAPKTQKYQVSFLYAVNNIDNVFQVYIDDESVGPGEDCKIRIIFKPTIPGHSYIDYYLIDDSSNNSYRLTVRGTCYGPKVALNKKKIVFEICKNVCEERKKIVELVNSSPVDTLFQWYLPRPGIGFFQVSTGNCGLIRAYESVSTTVIFTGTIPGTYMAEFVCLVHHQEPVFLDVIGTYTLPGNPELTPVEYLSSKCRKRSPYSYFMENSLDYVSNIPSATVFDRFLDFGTGSVDDISLNISCTFCVTNQEDEDAYFQWIPDPEEIFLVDPVGATLLPKTSKLFTVRFRPKSINKAYGYLLCGFFQIDKYCEDNLKVKNVWFRMPCIGNTWDACIDWSARWECQQEIVLPPTVPGKVVFRNFTLSNKLETQMLFKFIAPQGSRFVVMPMCGNLLGRGWQIVSVGLQPRQAGYYYEHWDLLINKSERVRLSFHGNAEVSHIEVMSNGYNPSTHAMLIFPPTITNCTNDVVSHFHNMTRLAIHLRMLNSVSWLGADNCGSIVLQPNEILPYHWWFFPKVSNKVYETTVTCSCVCLMDGKPVGEPTEIFINITGFSEYPKLKVLPKKLNLHDVVVGDAATFDLTIYNFGTCSHTFVLLHELDGMDDDHTSDFVEFTPKMNSLEASQHCIVKGNVIPNGAGPRQINLKFSVLYHSEFKHIVHLKPEEKNISTIWYDGIYPCLKVYRTISVKSQIALSGHCLWNIMNVDTLNESFMDCRPDKQLTVNLYAPDLYVGAESVDVILVLGCVYGVPVDWTLKRDKLCDCPMVEVQTGISTYEKRHTCIHRPLVRVAPMGGVVEPNTPLLLLIRFAYRLHDTNTLGFVLTLPNKRSINLRFSITANRLGFGILTALRRPTDLPDYLVLLDCGRVPINNLEPVIRIVWLYNPTNVYSTWRLLRGQTNPQAAIRCILYFAEVPPLGRLAIPIAFLPTEMIDYEVVFNCSFGFDTVKMLVRGQGGLPNCNETRLDIPGYIKNIMRAQRRDDVVWLSHEHVTIPVMATHSLERELIALTNDTDHLMRFIWLPERIPNIVNICMTPSWGVIQPKSTQWITMTVYSSQEPATFTISVVCELLDLTAHREYQCNELLRRNKAERCAQEFIITEDGVTYPGINDNPPFVFDLPKPVPYNLAISVAICTLGQRDGHKRLHLRQMLEQTPPYDLLTSDNNIEDFASGDRVKSSNISMADVIRIIDGILWDALHSKMMKFQLQYLAKEEIPTYSQLSQTLARGYMPQLSKRVTSGICDAIVNKAVFDVYSLNPEHDINLLDM